MFHSGKTLLAVSTMFRREYGIRDAHRKIHIVSPHAVAGEFDNPLEPIIEEADADPDGKFILEHKLTGTKKEQWTLLGNTIPTIFTTIIGKQILKHLPMLARNG